MFGCSSRCRSSNFRCPCRRYRPCRRCRSSRSDAGNWPGRPLLSPPRSRRSSARSDRTRIRCRSRFPRVRSRRQQNRARRRHSGAATGCRVSHLPSPRCLASRRCLRFPRLPPSRLNQRSRWRRQCRSIRLCHSSRSLRRRHRLRLAEFRRFRRRRCRRRAGRACSTSFRCHRMQRSARPEAEPSERCDVCHLLGVALWRRKEQTACRAKTRFVAHDGTVADSLSRRLRRALRSLRLSHRARANSCRCHSRIRRVPRRRSSRDRRGA